MPSREEIQEELVKTAPKLAQMVVREPFIVPEDYFTRLPGVVMARIRTLQASTAAEEEETLSPLLAQLSKKMPFSVPSQYFEQLPHQVAPPAPEISREATGKVFRLSRRAMRMGVAAAAAVLIVAGIWIFTREPAATALQTVAKIDNAATGDTTAAQQSLLHYMQYVSDAELVQYVEPGSSEADPQPDAPEVAPPPGVNDEDFSLLLAGVSDQELENYLAISDI